MIKQVMVAGAFGLSVVFCLYLVQGSLPLPAYAFRFCLYLALVCLYESLSRRRTGVEGKQRRSWSHTGAVAAGRPGDMALAGSQRVRPAA